MNEIDNIEEFKEKNIGFRLLYNPDQTKSSAMLFLQWCLAPQVAQYMKQNSMREAQIFVSVHSPRGRETRFVFPLASEQELIEFHCPGTHKITAVLAWGEKLYCAHERYLEKYDRHSYKFFRDTALREGECTPLGEADLSVEVADGFFAPKMSPRQEWYVNLWFSEPPWDECEIRHRKWIAYTVQTALLALWIPFICVFRFLIAFSLSVLVLRKNVPWQAVVHPFDYDMNDLMTGSEIRWEHQPVLHLFKPFVQFVLIGVAGAIGAMTIAFSDLFFLDWSSGVCTLVAYGIIVLAWIVVCLFPAGLTDKMMTRMREREGLRRKDGLDKLYAELLCTTAPRVGVRTKRRGFKGYAVLTYHNIKVRMCRPTAQG